LLPTETSGTLGGIAWLMSDAFSGDLCRTLWTIMCWRERTGETKTGRGLHEELTVPEVELLGHVGHGQPQRIAQRLGFSLPTRGGRIGGAREEFAASSRVEAAHRANPRQSRDP
jgi:hypothetical protein